VFDGRIIQEAKRSEVNTASQTASVSGQMADTDYFLNGKAYAQSERSVVAGSAGLRYYQFQFRLTDARTGIIEWEKMYRVKREGVLERVRR